jgi:two-component system cell cycle sensor histidine kinase/response regulator CckA
MPVKVLIVDDDPSMCQYVDRVLRNYGYVTTVAFDSHEALAKATTEGPFDLLLTDEEMPGLRGHELASHVRQLDPDVKVLYLTGYSDLLFTERGALWDGEAFVDKPVTPQGLREAISLLLSGHTI